MAEPKQNLPVASGPPLYATLPPAVRQIGLLVGIAAAVAAGVALVFWSQSPNFTLLYTGLADRDVGEIVAVMDTSGIPYKLDPATGGVMVPADRKYDVRMQLATAGLPRGAGFGIEQIPELGGFGQTPFMENALYMRALETELSRTIGSMRPVEAARVHLAVPPQSVFARQQRQSSASVMLTLYPGRRLDDAQVQSVVHLVASSVPELSPQRVTVVDQNGTLLTLPESDSTAALSRTQFEYRKQLEESYARRIEDLLSRVVGIDRVRASVAAELDFTVNEQTRESFDPNAAVVRSEQTSEEQRSGDALAQGVPGSLTNQPPELLAQGPDGAAAGPPGAAATGTAPPTSTSRSQTRNFEIDKTISHTKQAVGTIQRLSIGVLVDNRPAAGGRGPGQPLSDEEVGSMTELVKQAVGFDEARGDTISVVNSAFQAEPPIGAPAPLAFWEQPLVWSIARQVLGAALVLVLAWFIVRPIMGTLTRPQPLIAADGYPGGVGQSSLPGRGAALPVGYDDRVAAARNVAGQDPRQVAQVVRNWVAEDSG